MPAWHAHQNRLLTAAEKVGPSASLGMTQGTAQPGEAGGSDRCLRHETHSQASHVVYSVNVPLRMRAAGRPPTRCALHGRGEGGPSGERQSGRGPHCRRYGTTPVGAAGHDRPADAPPRGDGRHQAHEQPLDLSGIAVVSSICPRHKQQRPTAIAAGRLW
jgi:hypothetical protein